METQELLLEKHPVRRTIRQRYRFLSDAKAYAESIGWTCRYLDTGTSRCLLIGNENTAKITISACYETLGKPLIPTAIYPAVRPLSLFLRFLPLILIVLVFPVVATTARTGLTLTIFEILFLTLAIFFTLRIFLMPANRENYNCNSSGCAVLLHLVKVLSANNRRKAVFLLWDRPDEYRSGVYRARNSAPSLASLPFIHLSCVGDGDRLLLLLRKGTEGTEEQKTLLKALKRRGAKSGVSVDRANTRYGILCGPLRGVDAELCAVYGRLPFSKIKNAGTHLDTTCDPGLLVLLSEALRSAVETL